MWSGVGSGSGEPSRSIINNQSRFRDGIHLLPSHSLKQREKNLFLGPLLGTREESSQVTLGFGVTYLGLGYPTSLLVPSEAYEFASTIPRCSVALWPAPWTEMSLSEEVILLSTSQLCDWRRALGLYQGLDYTKNTYVNK